MKIFRIRLLYYKKFFTFAAREGNFDGKKNVRFFLPSKKLNQIFSIIAFQEKTLRCSEKNTTMFRRKHCDVFYNKYPSFSGQNPEKKSAESAESSKSSYFSERRYRPRSVFT